MTTGLLDKLFTLRRPQPPAPVPPGLYHTLREADGQITRLHLRVEPDGSGMLIANAAAAARLSPVGVVIAKRLLDNRPELDILHELQDRFHDNPAARLEYDLAQVKLLLRDLAQPGDRFPVFNLEDAAVLPGQASLIAPLEASVPLAAPEKMAPILSRLWDVGIPHVTILTPVNPNPLHLVRAVERAEDLGLICGVSGRASDLSVGTLLDDLALAGLDHVTVFYASAHAAVHDALLGSGDHAAAELLFRRTQMLEMADVGLAPLVASTIDHLEATLNALLALHVTNVSFFAIAAAAVDEQDGAIPAPAMRQVAAQVEEEAEEARVAYLWLPPVQRDPDLTLAQQVQQGPRCAGDVAVRIEVDGLVMPARGPAVSAGNLLHNSWEAIWDHPAFRRYRGRVEAPTRCQMCPGLAICAADCPAEPAGWATKGRR